MLILAFLWSWFPGLSGANGFSLVQRRRQSQDPSTVWDWSEENKTRSGIRMKEGDMEENNA